MLSNAESMTEGDDEGDGGEVARPQIKRRSSRESSGGRAESA
jgi:hypothetical protein